MSIINLKNKEYEVIKKLRQGGYGSVIPTKGQWGWPATCSSVSSPFGWRWGVLHDGTDIAGCGYGSNIFAAQSGTGEKAFFKNLNQLKVNDIIIIIWNNNELTYTVDKVWKEEKMGYIRIPNSIQNNLILTTCDPTEENMQLIIGCTKKESK